MKHVEPRLRKPRRPRGQPAIGSLKCCRIDCRLDVVGSGGGAYLSRFVPIKGARALREAEGDSGVSRLAGGWLFADASKNETVSDIATRSMTSARSNSTS